MLGLQCGEETMTCMLNSFYRILERNGRTDGQTSGQTDRIAIISLSRASVLTRDNEQSSRL